ncbi:cytochrome c biogenesis CcdA family protein [Corynebacterium halotolerans]|uniref:Cytochrome c-type biogenesis protein n=1 Tax=Corynebacterium halotolerans YIM 70093 = DSM 44683 TaxID=1121362 RepID=M1NI39_9CORY|nr:cytochrome c biogenesis CcdA family protein [Corynebacterium halotolerans]AGF71058.1 cytochrome c-type biogenesis protein [Corynebacterium halotolerans YIM 70093 = DSM 44683]
MTVDVLAQLAIGEQFATTAATGPLLLGILAAAAAGLVSFASPCVIPLVPGYMSYLAGVVGAEVDYDAQRGPVITKRQWAVAGAAGLFILGFTVVFVLATVTAFGAISMLTLNADTLMRLGGVVTILMGLVFMGLVPALQRDTRLSPKGWTTWLGAPLLGGVFALGWTPCLGPTLAAIISVSAGTEGMTAVRGVALIIGYCLGLGLPFLLVAFGSARAMRTIDWLRRHSRKIQILGGVLMVLVGIALLSGAWAYFINWVRQWTVEYGATLL